MSDANLRETDEVIEPLAEWERELLGLTDADAQADEEPEVPLSPEAIARASALFLAAQVLGTDVLTEDLISAASYIVDGTQVLERAPEQAFDCSGDFLASDGGDSVKFERSSVPGAVRIHDLNDATSDYVYVDDEHLDHLIAYLTAVRAERV